MERGEQQRYAEELGERLRNVRQQQGLSLHDVELQSGGALKASVVGAYERGERAISVTRLRALAEFYRVPIGQLLPGRASRRVEQPVGMGLRIDLVRLHAGPLGDLEIVERYIGAIQARRGDYNGRVLTVRADDIKALAAVLDRDPYELREELLSSGIASEAA